MKVCGKQLPRLVAIHTKLLEHPKVVRLEKNYNSVIETSATITKEIENYITGLDDASMPFHVADAIDRCSELQGRLMSNTEEIQNFIDSWERERTVVSQTERCSKESWRRARNYLQSEVATTGKKVAIRDPEAHGRQLAVCGNPAFDRWPRVRVRAPACLFRARPVH